MRQLALVLSLWVCAPVFAEPPSEPTPRPRIRLHATLDPRLHRVDGEVWFQLVNTAQREVSELYLHLYPNAFASDQTVFMREGGGQIRNQALAARGGMTLSLLEAGAQRSAGSDSRSGAEQVAGSDLLASAETELVAQDKTQLRVTLPRAVQPGETLELHARFRTQLPEIVARSGYAGEFHLLGQWFPKLAKLEPDGTFASFPYHGIGEFYADFADYELTLRVPREYVTAAGGVRVATREAGAFREDTFLAERVHDIVAACYPSFERRVGRSGNVRIELYAPRGYAAAAERQLQLIAAGLKYFSAAYGPYAYPQLTVVIPPRAGRGAAGMEYPTMFLSDGRWWALPAWLPDADQDVVAAHELAHQWFSGMIATNEVEIPLLDEGLAEWSSLEFLREHARSRDTLLDPLVVLEAVFLFRGHPVPSSLLPAYKYTYETLHRAIYLRPARVLAQIERRHGRPRLMAAMRRYALAGRFQHPGIADFYAAFDAVFGAGFSARELSPALEGKTDMQDAGTVRPSVTRFFPDVWFAVQALLHVLGP
jgi:hypothetical protein